MSYDLSDFQTDVLDRSQRTPVLVDFWAEWCGPCKMLGPVLERLADQAGNRWVLVKINTETHPDLAAQYAIRSIPSVKLFHQGKVVAEFAGALPEPQIRAWLDQHLPTPQREAMARARQLLHAGRASEAAALLQPLAAAAPADEELAVLTARALLFQDPAAAEAKVNSLSAHSAWRDEARVVQALAAAIGRLSPEGAPLPAGAVRDRYLTGLRALQQQDFRTAAADLVEVLLEKPDFDEGRAKAACLALFQHLGLRHPISEEFFRRYSMAVNS